MTMCMTPLAAPHSQKDHGVERRFTNGSMLRPINGKRGLDLCDSSNDSGLGFDNHNDYHNRIDHWTWSNDHAQPKRSKLDIKLENEESNDNFTFADAAIPCKDTISIIRGPSTQTPSYIKSNRQQNTPTSRPIQRRTSVSCLQSGSQPDSLLSQLSNKPNESDISLRIINQPEQQHRARYQTEGSRGAVKDRSGNGFPVVQLVGYHKPATLEVFIGTDIGKVAPHMFYQACRVSGKNSTPCLEKKLDGTVVIQLQLDPIKDMVGTCDCVGILKERNVDVEHRFPEQVGSRSKKKSTRCRMIFRTTITHNNGVQETLQICSQPIVCTQPPGIPEICKKSLSSCPAAGGLELYILGKNFLKDTKVCFQQVGELGLQWEQHVIPDKEYLQQTHLVCVVPPYARLNITEPVTVRLVVVSSGKTSEPHQFVYTPTSGSVSSVNMETSPSSSFLTKSIWSASSKQDQHMMLPPGTCHVPITQHRVANITEVESPTHHVLKQEVFDENSEHSTIDSPVFVKRQLRRQSENSRSNSDALMGDESSLDVMQDSNTSLDSVSHFSNDNSIELIMRQNHPQDFNRFAQNETENRMRELRVMDLRMKLPPVTVSDLAYTNAPSMATLRSFGVTESTNAPLPTQTAQSIENYLSKIEDQKSIAVDAMHLSQLLNTPHNQITDQVIPSQNLLVTTHLGTMHSHLGVANFNNNQSVPTGEQMLMQPNGLVSDAKMNMPLAIDDSSQSRNMLVGNKSPQDLQSPLMISATVQNIPTDMILNTQISPSLMCPTTALASDNLLTNMCQSSPQLMLSESSPQQALTNQLSPVITSTASEKAILLKAAVDLLETQQKITQLETLSSTTTDLPSSIEMMNTILSSSHDSTSQMRSNLSTNLIVSPQLVESVTVKDISNQTHPEKKNEDRMIPTGFTTMTENELISMINPSCFDQV